MLGRSLPRTSPWKCVPPRVFSLGFVTSRSFFGAVANYYRRSLLYSIVQKPLLRRSLPHTPAFQRSLWKCVPPISSLSSSVPSRHGFGAVATYYMWSLQYSIVQKLFLGKYFRHTPAFQRSLWKCVPPREFSLGFGAMKACFGAVAGYYRRSLQYSIVQKLFLGRSLPHTPVFKRSLWKCVPLVSSLSGLVPSSHRYGAIAIY